MIKILDKISRKHYIQCGLAILLTGVVLYFTSALWVSNNIVVSFNANAEKDITYQVFYTEETGQEFNEKQSVKKQVRSGNQKVEIVLPIQKIVKFRLDVGRKPGNVEITDLQVKGFRNIKLDYGQFSKNQIDKFEVKNGKLYLHSNQDDPYLPYKRELNLPVKVIDYYYLILILLMSTLFPVLLYKLGKYLNKFEMVKNYLPKCSNILLYTPLLLICILKYTALFDKLKSTYYGNSSLRYLLNFYSAETFILILFSVLMALYFLFKKIRWIIITLTMLLMFILLIDYVVIDNLDARFIFSEILTQGKDVDTAWEMLKKYLLTTSGKINVVLILNVVFIFVYFRHTSKKITYSFLVILGLLIVNSQIVWSKGIFDFKFYNVFDANFKNHKSNKHSEQKIMELHKSFNLKQECLRGKNTMRNVILIIAESLSSYKISGFNGLEDRMPKLDSLAKEGLSFKNFYGNSFNTNGGTFSVLTGVPLIQGYQNLGDLKFSHYYDKALPKRLHDSGYFSVFFSSINYLGTGMGNLVKNSGFDTMSDSNDPYYENKERIIFSGVSDDVLFANVINYLHNHKEQKPFLYVISTITTHGPYIDPITGEKSFDKTLAFLDNALYDFISVLKKENFFSNDGIVLITGDHRAMLPVSSAEYERYGYLADKAMPLIVLGENIPTRDEEGTFSQTDITPSLEYYLTEKGCFNKFQRNLFDSGYHKNVCVTHSYLSPGDKCGVYCSEDKHADIYLDGDNTSISDERLKDYKDYVVYLRTLPVKQ